mmetsp:Transcript_14342/g.42822  ORF Transcript_14342/g.42822 Transcript_14342/m.42822 type:complete len:455 (+) Transcript_14342:170-1534(+)
MRPARGDRAPAHARSPRKDRDDGSMSSSGLMTPSQVTASDRRVEPGADRELPNTIPSYYSGIGSSAHSSLHSGPVRFVDMLASGTVKDQRMRSTRPPFHETGIFVEMDDGGGDVYLSGRVSPRLPASRARVTFRLSLSEEKWVAKNGEWLYEGMTWQRGADPRAPAPKRRPGRRVVGVVSTRKQSSACFWITTGDLDGGVYCLSKWCPGGRSPRLGAVVSFELKHGKYGDWRVASPPGLAVLCHEEDYLRQTSLGERLTGGSAMTPPGRPEGPTPWDRAPGPLPAQPAPEPRRSPSRYGRPNSPARMPSVLSNISANLSTLLQRVTVADEAAPRRRTASASPLTLPATGPRPPRIIDDSSLSTAASGPGQARHPQGLRQPVSSLSMSGSGHRVDSPHSVPSTLSMSASQGLWAPPTPRSAASSTAEPLAAPPGMSPRADPWAPPGSIPWQPEQR